MFTPPRPNEQGIYDLKAYTVAGLTDLRNMAAQEHGTLVASITEDALDEARIASAEELAAFVAAADTELDSRAALAARAASQQPIQARTATPVTPATTPEVTEAVTAGSGFDQDGNKDVADTTPAVPVVGTETAVVEATVTASGGTKNAPRRSVQVSDLAPHTTIAEIPESSAGFTIVAAADIATFPTGTELSWDQVGKAFEERVRAYPSGPSAGAKTRMQHSLVRVRRDFPEAQVINMTDGHESAYLKLRKTADDYSHDDTRDAVTAANGWCAPSEPDYSICSPITSDGLLSLPEMVLRRGGLLHNQGLDFADFFGNDFVLPIPGYNILTEAQVIADTAKTCVEIPCPSFVDDRLNVAALCLTSSLLQNRGYPEFVSEFVQGSIAAMAHLVNREVVNEIETGSTSIVLSTLDPWVSDGSVWSQLLSAIDMVAMNIRYMYRTSQTQQVQMVFPYWVRTGLRADWLRRNATFTEELTDEMVNAALARRNVSVQWIYDWQDAFDPANGAGAIDVNHQFGNSAGPIAAALFNMPTSVTFLAFLPGTWVLGRQDVIRLDTVYDSTNLQQNLVTQLFMEDGFKPMKMCQFSFAYTINICANGSTGVQRAVTCTDVTP
jgi:hypothetical protein